jgi:D-alanyl-D-alanine carboxypeptidase
MIPTETATPPSAAPLRIATAASERSPPTFRLNGPQQNAAQASLPNATGVHLQIGAFATEAEAGRQLATVRQKATDLLAGGQPVTVAAQANGRTLYRARFTGFDAARAGTVCTELRRRQIDCMVTKSE